MAGTKEIRTRIKSVQQTLKITSAMYLISSANLRKAKGQLDRAAPYFTKIDATIADILHRSPELEHKFFDPRTDVPEQERKVGYIVVSGDKGLAGAYNHNVLRRAEEYVRASRPTPASLWWGSWAGSTFRAGASPSWRSSPHVVQNPTMRRAREIGDEVVRRFLDRSLDEVHILYTEMVSPLKLEVRERTLLPLDRANFHWEPPAGQSAPQEVTYVPSPEAVLDNIIPSGYIRGMVFGALVESFSSEQSARMTAMEAASDNAKEMLRSLSLTYNRARQSAITQEITEIASGAQVQGER